MEQRALVDTRAVAVVCLRPRQQGAEVACSRMGPMLAEALRVEALRVEALRVEALRVEAPRVEALRVEALRVEALRVEALRMEALRMEALRMEARGVVSSVPGEIAGMLGRPAVAGRLVSAPAAEVLAAGA